MLRAKARSRVRINHSSQNTRQASPLLSSSYRIPVPPSRVLNPSGAESIAVVDYGFHKRTGSAEFFLQLLSKKFRVECFYDRAPTGQYRRIVCWQVPPTMVQGPVIWVPMWDSFCTEPQVPANVTKVLSFSRALHENITACGKNSRYFQYWPEPQQPSHNLLPVVLFWKRTKHVTWPHVRTMLNKLENVSVHLKMVPDPGYAADIIPPIDAAKFGIQTHAWSADRAAFVNLLERCNIFIAPRLREGIGMAFLEAMSHGLCVVAHNEATANEYIRHGETGLLYNDPETVDLKRYRDIGNAAHEAVTNGHRNWTESQDDLLAFIAS